MTLADDDTNLMLSEGDSHGKDFWGGHGLNLDGGRRNMLTGICTSRKRRWLREDPFALTPPTFGHCPFGWVGLN